MHAPHCAVAPRIGRSPALTTIAARLHQTSLSVVSQCSAFPACQTTTVNGMAAELTASRRPRLAPPSAGQRGDFGVREEGEGAAACCFTHEEKPLR